MNNLGFSDEILSSIMGTCCNIIYDNKMVVATSNNYKEPEGYKVVSRRFMHKESFYEDHNDNCPLYEIKTLELIFQHQDKTYKVYRAEKISGNQREIKFFNSQEVTNDL